MSLSRFVSISLIAAILCLLPGPAAPQAATGRERLPDGAITEAVEDALYLDEVAPFNRIDVATDGGIVT